MSATVAVAAGSAVLVLAALPVAVTVVAQRRHTRRLVASGLDPQRIALDVQRRGYARGLVPIVEDLLDRVEALEAEVDRLSDGRRES